MIIETFLDAIKLEDADSFFRMYAHSEEDEKHAGEIFKSLKDVKMTVQSAKKSEEGKINAVVLFTFEMRRESEMSSLQRRN